jgi:hypothetical protein
MHARYVSKQAAADALGVSRFTVHNRIAAGKIPVDHTGRILREDFERSTPGLRERRLRELVNSLPLYSLPSILV